ncbi:hypothetical protein [Paenibacillus xylanivorans]|uniref:Major facilitator superfamily (MFS) profile domain-containing protein n=1 Tax=Paenibacillus xylanivorans TaxID=1705561 RepID=A0A0N0UHF3_9BACL|nr:hypothetical protein [Paenibacillus xylanivorans]KOY14765.1 hypothetical protein AMS66_19710 [Paenibacillus xylanivorans]
MIFAEGSANDRIPLIMVDGYETSSTTSTFIYSIFLASMTIIGAIGDSIGLRMALIVVLIVIIVSG